MQVSPRFSWSERKATASSMLSNSWKRTACSKVENNVSSPISAILWSISIIPMYSGWIMLSKPVTSWPLHSNVTNISFRLPRRLTFLLSSKGQKANWRRSPLLLHLNPCGLQVLTREENNLQRYQTGKHYYRSRWTSQNCRFRLIEVSRWIELIHLHILWKPVIYGTWNAQQKRTYLRSRLLLPWSTFIWIGDWKSAILFQRRVEDLLFDPAWINWLPDLHRTDTWN